MQHHDFETGTKALMSIAGVGKMSPNMVMLGFKKDWRTDMDGLEKYMNTLYNAFDMNLSVGILRVKKGLDYSHVSFEISILYYKLKSILTYTIYPNRSSQIHIAECVDQKQL